MVVSDSINIVTFTRVEKKVDIKRSSVECYSYVSIFRQILRCQN